MVRQHEEFIWLHDSFVENEEYAGFIVSTAILALEAQNLHGFKNVPALAEPGPVPKLQVCLV